MIASALFKKNLSIFKARFPYMASEATASNVYQCLTARNGSVTAKDKIRRTDGTEEDVLLHSMYDPEREAQKTISKSLRHSAIFLGFGLGYAPIAWARRQEEGETDGALILIESDKARFFAALHTLDWTSVFRVKHLVMALGCPVEQVIALITNVTDIRDCDVFATPAQTAHDVPYFTAVSALIARNRRKEEINDATTKRFAKRWITNICLNATSVHENVCMLLANDAASNEAKNGKCTVKVPHFAATILAAGPSLEGVLQHLAEIKKHSLVIAVDTALRAALRAGVEPDYIVLSDPQYYAYRHIAGLASPSSFLVTDLSAYPAVLRFDCKRVLLSHSAIPLAQYFECQIMGTMGKRQQVADLGAGGSVASCAWNLAYLLGATNIYIAGLDLSFPRGETHVKGSMAEEEAHITSGRLCTAENKSVPRLIDGASDRGTDYNGNTVVTDSRMLMFAWWFESRLAEVRSKSPAVKTYTLCPSGLRIPGIEIADISQLLSCANRKHSGYTEYVCACSADCMPSSHECNATLKRDIATLECLADEALTTADKARLQDIALEMHGNNLMKYLFFQPLRTGLAQITPAAMHSVAIKTLEALRSLTAVAERFHLF